MKNGLMKPENPAMHMERTAGELNRSAMLTNAQARHIRKCFRNGVPLAELGALFGMRPGSVYRVAHGLSYREAGR